jgi:Tfp pilus assembly protein PilO
MKSSDRAILAGLVVAGLIAAFWFVLLSPKREEASKLEDDVAALQQSVNEQEQLVAAAEQAREDFNANYRRLVVLGKAVPEDEDTSSLFVQLGKLAADSGVEFDTIVLNASGTGAPAPASAAAETTVDGAAPPESSSEGEEPASAPAPVSTEPTEAAAAGLPIGATVGPAGLPVMPYTVGLRGSFFELADFLAGVDRLVHSRHGRDVVDGRLVTIDGFGLAGDPEDGFKTLTASLAVTTFVTPADQGLTAGATPAGPPAEVPAPGAPTPASTTTPSPAP